VDEGLEVVALGSRFALALVFLTASVPKLLAPADFALAVRNYRLLPRGFDRPVGMWLPRLELALGVALLVGFALRVAGLVAACVLLIFVCAVSANLARGRRIECGCYSPAAPRSIGWGLVGYDAVLMFLALIVVSSPQSVLAVDALWRGDSGAVSPSEAIAIALLAFTLVLAGQLIRESVRVLQTVRMASDRVGGEPL
jgi:uncharacterized membrane protein YphA (DoxX/SURF4 family)